MRKYRYSFFFLLLTILTISTCGPLTLVNASPGKSSKVATEYVNEETGFEAVIQDEAGLLQDEAIAPVLESMKAVTAYGNALFVISENSNGSDSSDLAREYYRAYFDRESGSAFLIDMNRRQLYIFSDGKVYKTINKRAAYTITDNVYTYAAAEDYESCAVSAFEQMSTLLEGGRIAQPMRLMCAFLLACALALIITYIWAKYSCVTDVKDQNLLLDSQLNHRDLKKVKKTYVFRQMISSSSDGGSSSGSRSGGGGGSSGGGGGHGF